MTISFGDEPVDLKEARDAAGLPLPRTRWDDDRVIHEIQALQDARPSRNLIGIAQRRFGSWRAALAAAGVPAKVRPPWTRESIHAALRKRAARGQALTRSALLRDDRALYDALRNRFGGVAHALEQFVATGELL